MKTIIGFVISALFSVNYVLVAQEALYKDSRQPVEARVQDLLPRMTLEEKVDQLNMKSLNSLQLDTKGEVTDSSLVKMFGGRSIGCLESPFVEHDKVAT